MLDIACQSECARRWKKWRVEECVAFSGSDHVLVGDCRFVVGQERGREMGFVCLFVMVFVVVVDAEKKKVKVRDAGAAVVVAEMEKKSGDCW